MLTGGLLALSLGVATTQIGSAAQTPAVAPTTVAPSTFNAADYELAWQAFLGAGRLDDAIALATQALRAEPDSVLWHTRLASAAEQNGESALAARHYAWLALQGQRGEVLGRAIDLATGTNQGDLLLPLLQWRATHEPFNAAHWDQLIAGMLDGAQIDPLLALLERADRASPKRYFLEQQVRVQVIAGRPDAVATTLRRMIARYGNEVWANLQLATREYMQGDLEQALVTLRAARPHATPQDTLYWQTLGSLAWMLQDFAVAEHAAQVLERTGQAQPADYSRLYRLHEAKDPAVAYAHAVVGWRHTREPTLFFAAAIAAERFGQVALMRDLFDSVRPEDQAMMATQPQFWTLWAQLAQREDLGRTAVSRYAHALSLAPGDAGTLAGFVWLLVNSERTDLLRPLVQRLSARPPAGADLRQATIAALARLDQPSRALAWMWPQRAEHQSDADWLAQWADLLDQADQPEAAHAARRTALAVVTRQQRPQHVEDARQLRDARIALTARLAPGDPARVAIKSLAEHPDSATARDLVLAWTIDSGSAEATSLWLDRQYAKGKPPAWASLSHSLATDNDTRTMQLLTQDGDRLPRRDRVTAADKLGWTPLALTLAYEGLQAEPTDRQLAMQFQNLAPARADSVGTTQGLRRGGGLRALDSTLESRSWLSSAWSLDLEIRRVDQRVEDDRQLGAVPGHASYGSATLVHHQPRAELGLIMGVGRNLAGYGQVGAYYRYRWSRSWQLGAYADVGARVDDTVPLSIFGRADQFKASASHQWSARDSVTATASAGRLRAQGGGELGAKQSLGLEYRHMLWLAPPDISVFAAVSNSHYQRASTLPLSVRRVLPAGQTVDIGSVVPRSFAQLCVGAGFNEGERDGWRGRPRLFASTSACHNSVFGVAASVDAGVATPLIGPDQLRFGFGFSSNTATSSSSSLSVQVNYRYYFTP